MFKAGDKVICVDDSVSAGKLVNGREYEVTGKSYCDSGDMFVFLFGFGDSQFYIDRFKLKEKDMFTLEDIKEGYLVETKGNEYFTVLRQKDGYLFGVNENFSIDLNLYSGKDSRECYYDVIKVYDKPLNYSEGLNKVYDRKLLWEYKETKEMTVAEIEKELGYPIKVVK